MHSITKRILLAFSLFSLIFTLIPLGYATTENRFFRSDIESVGELQFRRLLTSNTDTYATESESWYSTFQLSQAYLRSLIYVYHQDNTFTLIATSGGVIISGSTPTLYSENVAIPQTALDSTDRIYIQIQYSEDGSTWTSLASARFITEKLNATILNNATWTIYYYAMLTNQYLPFQRRWQNTISFYFGDNTYNSRVEGFSYTTEAKEWHNIDSLNFNITTKAWFNLDTLPFNILTKQWHPLDTLIFNIITKAWHSIDTLIFQLKTKQWNPLDYLFFTLKTEQIAIPTKHFPFPIIIGGILILAIAVLWLYGKL